MLQPNHHSFQSESVMINQLRPSAGNQVNTTYPFTKLFLILLFTFFTGVIEQLHGQATFTKSAAEACTPTTINFTDTSTPIPSSWFWNFGNSNGSIVQNPSANYPQPGVYSVTLTINGSVTSAPQTISVYPKPNPTIPVTVQG